LYNLLSICIDEIIIGCQDFTNSAIVSELSEKRELELETDACKESVKLYAKHNVK